MTPQITHVWSQFGHRFMSTGEGEYESCLTCGAMYELRARADDPTGGDYQAANGDDPQDCTGNTSMEHGYPGERASYDGDAGHACNCLFCDS